MGDHGQIGDRFVEKRDITYPAFRRKHRPTAARYGIERSFERWLAERITASALRAGRYGEAVRFGCRAIKVDPLAWRPYVYVGLAVGGDLTYGPAVRAKRRYIALSDS